MTDLTDAAYWAGLMGRDLPAAPRQPLEAVRVNRNGVVKIGPRSLRAAGLAPGDGVRLAVRGGRCTLEEADDGKAFVSGKPLRLPATAGVVGAISPPGAHGAVLVAGDGGPVSVLPVRVVAHAPDVLAPRFIDELGDGEIVRHVVPGPAREGWTGEALDELAGLLCGECFRADPVEAIAAGDDWVAWMARRHLLARPGGGDEALRETFVRQVHEGGCADGSWGSVPATAYAILRLLALGESPGDERIRRAASWLLDRPEPPPRPGMWMLTDDYLREWMSKRRPSGPARLAPAELLPRVPPDGKVSFYSWEFPDAEQDEFRGPEVQQVVPICARHHPPACEPRVTHVSAVAAAALMACGHADHPRVRRYLHTAMRLGGEWGYWCGCGALGLCDADLSAEAGAVDFDVRAGAPDASRDLSPWRWADGAEACARLANRSDLPEAGTGLEPFTWRVLPGRDGAFALIGTGWQNGDCWAKVNRALAAHPACAGSLVEHLAVFQASRYQTSLGEWDQGFPAGMLAWLALYDSPPARALAIRTVPWLREHQEADGLWHHEGLFRADWGKPATPAEPRLATYHVAAALAKFGFLERLRT